MGKLRYKWLRFLGYEPYKYVTVRNSWDGDPPFDYTSELKMRKGLSIKVVPFKNISDGLELKKIIMEMEQL